ncbi:hypothetical protein WA158_002917 [Blastocystis sp. Blastoise]
MATFTEERYRVLEKYLTAGVILFILIGGIAAGFIEGPDSSLPSPINYLSQIVGWVYFFAWSVSFYPQIYLNWKTKSVVGMSFDFQIYNFLGFFFYTCYNGALLFSQSVIDQYVAAFQQQPTVRMNDFFFSTHAFLITCFTIFQICIYDRKDQKISKLCIAISSSFLNWKRKSTKGFNIGNILLDFTGGALSEIQFFVITGYTNAWSGILGNIVKFGLGWLSIFFDIIFMIQHYGLYKENDNTKSELVTDLLNDITSPTINTIVQSSNSIARLTSFQSKSSLDISKSDIEKGDLFKPFE